jgi:pimeloyl-ACP methyl ester carboxylesterase
VLERVRAAGIAAEASPNPLRGLTFDGEYVASVLGQIDGAIVLVGHSYGGAVMTYANSKAPNVRALVYVASFGLDQGAGANHSVADYPPPELASSVEVRTFPNGDEPGLEALIQRDTFHSAFCADVPVERQPFTAPASAPSRSLRSMSRWPIADEPRLRARRGERRRCGGHACECECEGVRRARGAGGTARTRRTPFVSVACIPAAEARCRDGRRRAPAGRARSAIATGVAATSAAAGPARRYGSGRRQAEPWWGGRS